MELVGFNAKCPFEIGDKVVMISNFSNKHMTITDIVCMHYVKSGEIEFRYELNEDGHYVKLGFNKENSENL